MAADRVEEVGDENCGDVVPLALDPAYPDPSYLNGECVYECPACLVERKQFNPFGAIALADARTGVGKTDLSKDGLTITEAMLREFRVAAITRRASNGPG